MDILEEREDPRFFNQELFAIEKQDKTMFRKMRAVSYQHCQLSNQFAEYISNIICALKSPKIIQTGCDNLIRRLNILGNVCSSKLEIKEKNDGPGGMPPEMY